MIYLGVPENFQLLFREEEKHLLLSPDCSAAAIIVISSVSAPYHAEITKNKHLPPIIFPICSLNFAPIHLTCSLLSSMICARSEKPTTTTSLFFHVLLPHIDDYLLSPAIVKIESKHISC